MTGDITILHVDDEAAYADLQKMYLEKIIEASLSTIITTDPTEVTEIIERSSVDCIVCDYDMPDIDGLDVLATVREEYPILPFILLTGKGNEKVASEAIRMGVTDYVQKPSGSKQYKMLGSRICNAVVRFRSSRRDRKEMRRFQNLLDRVADPLLTLDTDLCITYLNEGAEQFLDGSSESLLGAAVVDHLPKKSALEAELRRALDEETMIVAEGKFKSSSVEHSIRIYPDEDHLLVLILRPDNEGSSSVT
ncbi:response regulator [Halocatena marina]|uniref:response regulator n=1 Tax=Halocatena marina TaxID=2934937 RepID=UPI00200C9A79|nr:response regulator [Halocatena marina]